MTPEQYRKAGDLFHAALAVDTEHRSAFVAHACSDDEDLCREVESLPAAHRHAGQFIESPAMEVAATVIAAERTGAAPPNRIGRYEIVCLIARGGMGEVHRARDVTLGREVAIKFPHRLYAHAAYALVLAEEGAHETGLADRVAVWPRRRTRWRGRRCSLAPAIQKAIVGGAGGCALGAAR